MTSKICLRVFLQHISFELNFVLFINVFLKLEKALTAADGPKYEVNLEWIFVWIFEKKCNLYMYNLVVENSIW